MKVWKQEEWAEAVGIDPVGGLSGAQRSPGSQASSAEAADGTAGQLAADSVEECKRAREKAVYYLQFSGKTESELRKKLAEQEFSPASVDSAIEFVKKYRYLDDEDYTRRFIERNGQKKSRKQMMYELTQKGVSRDILDLVFEDMEVDEESQILALLAKRKYPGEAATREEKQKISSYLARKGFSYDAIQTALIQFARKNAD